MNGVAKQVGTFKLGEWEFENSIVYPGEVVEPPKYTDAPDVARNEVSESTRVTTRVFAKMTIIIAALLSLWVFRYWRTPVLRASQPLFLILFLTGISVSTSSVFYFYRDEEEYSQGENNMRCNLANYLVSVGITITCASLFVKLNRILLLAKKQETFRKKKIKLSWAFKRIGLLLFLDAIIITLVHLYSPLKYELTILAEDEFEQPISVYHYCTTDGGADGIYVLWFAYHIFLYVYGGYLVFKARGLSSDFQEGIGISISILTTIQLSILGIPVVVAIGPKERTIQLLVISLLICLSNIMMMGMIFGPKISKVATGNNEVSWKEPEHFVRNNSTFVITKKSSKRNMNMQSLNISSDY